MTSATRGFKLLEEQVEDLKVFAANPKQRIPFGLRDMDKLIRGPAQGEIFTMIARSGVGKSLLATNVMANNPDAAILFFSLEMPAHLVLQRLYSHVFGTPTRDVSAAILQNKLPADISKLGTRLPQQVMVDRPALTLDDMSAYCERYEAYFGFRPDMVIIDYLEEVAGAKASAEGWQRTEATASQLKAWSRNEEVGVLSLHQSNQKTEPWEAPHQGSAKGGGYTESDIVIGAWRPGWEPDLGEAAAHQQRHHIYMNVIKNRIFGELKRELRYTIDPAMRLTQLQPRIDGMRDNKYENNPDPY